MQYSSKFCVQCGAKLVPDSLFCNKCGAAIAEAFGNDEEQLPKRLTVDTEQWSINEESTVEEQPQAVKEEPKKQKKSVGTVPGSILIAVVLFVAITAGQTWFVMQNGLDNKAVKTMARAVFEQVDIAELPITVIDTDTTQSKATDKVVLYKYIYDSIDDYYVKTFDVEQDQIKELLQSDTFRDFFADILDDHIDYIMGDDSGINKAAVSERVVDLIKSNADEIEEITSYRLVESDYDDIRQILRDYTVRDLGQSIGGTNLGSSKIRNVFSLLTSRPIIALTVIITAVVVLTLLLILLNRQRIPNTLLYFGVPCIVSGGMFIAAKLLGERMVSSWLNDVIGFESVPAVAFNEAFSAAGDSIMLSSGVVLGVGMSMVVVRTFFRKNENSV